MIEKKVISHYFNAGGSCFIDANVFCFYYERLRALSEKVYVSHIVYQMLLDGYKFRPTEVDSFADWGNLKLLKYSM